MASKTLPLEMAIALQDDLISVLGNSGSQIRLRVALEKAGADPHKQIRARQEICLPLQAGVLKKYGFDDVAEALAAFDQDVTLAGNSDVEARKATLQRLVNPNADETVSAARSLREHDAIFRVSMAVGPGRFALPPGATLASSPNKDVEAEKVKAGRNRARSRPAASVRFDPELGFSPTRRSASLPPTFRKLVEQKVTAERKTFPPLDREVAMVFQDALIEKFRQPHFQDRLQTALEAAGPDPVQRSRVRQALCLPVQLPVARRFGFTDVAETIQAFAHLSEDPEIRQRKKKIDALVGLSEAGAICADSRKETKKIEGRPGRRWKVVGGARTGGLLVRRGPELLSAILGTRTGPARLATGAEVEELGLLGNRLHFNKIHGEGPNVGWASIELGPDEELLVVIGEPDVE